MITIADIKDRLGRKFRGSSIDDIGGVSDYSLFEEAASNLLSGIDPYETVRLHRFNHFDGIYDYEAPEYLKGKKVIDPRKQDGRQHEGFSQTFIKDFDIDKKFKSGKVSVEFQDGLKIIRLSEKGAASLAIDTTNAVTGWEASGGATDLALDEVIKLDGSDTLKLNLGVAGGYIENDEVDAVDMTEFPSSSLFRRIYLPSITGLTSLSLRIGSASGAYWTIAGQPHLGSYREGVNLVRFDFDDRVATGSPDITEITYQRLTFTTTAAINAVRVGPMTAKLPTPYEVPLYSNQLFRDSAGLWLDRITDSTDENKDDTEIMLERDAENIFFYECCAIAAEDLTLDDEAEKYKLKLYGHPGRDDDGGLYGQYNRDKPGEALPPTRRWLNFRGRKRITRFR